MFVEYLKVWDLRKFIWPLFYNVVTPSLYFSNGVIVVEIYENLIDTNSNADENISVFFYFTQKKSGLSNFLFNKFLLEIDSLITKKKNVRRIQK